MNDVTHCDLQPDWEYNQEYREESDQRIEAEDTCEAPDEGRGVEERDEGGEFSPHLTQRVWTLAHWLTDRTSLSCHLTHLFAFIY